MKTSSRERMASIVDYWIRQTRLDLKGQTLITEAATGSFAVMPALALKAGAERVFAWGRDSSYGTAEEAVCQSREWVSVLGVDEDRLTFAKNERPPSHLREASLVANTGQVRPLDRALLRELREGTVIGLMYDAWELRDSDLDLAFCRGAGLRVAGVDESHPDLRIFDACGPLAIKMSFEAGYEVAHNHIFVYSEDPFGEVIGRAFGEAGASSVTVSTDLLDMETRFADLDFLFLCSYREERCLIGEHGLIRLDEWGDGHRPGVVHLYGEVDGPYAEASGNAVYPRESGRAMRMSRTLDDLGPKISVGLCAAGLRAAVAVANGEKTDGGIQQVIV